ncbi:MAG: SLC13 family permease [Pleurocapsa sp.]
MLQHKLGIFTDKSRTKWFLLAFLSAIISMAIAIMPNFINSSPLGELSWTGWLTIGITIAAFLLNALTSLASEIIFLGAAAVLFVGGILDEKTALAGFSNEGMITVAVLYIVVTGLEQTGGLNLISQRVLGLPKTENAALLRMMLPVMGLSAFLNNTPIVAMFISVVNDWAKKLKISPSKLMIPLSYAAIFGGVCTLIGTSTNLVVNGLLIEATDHPGLKLFDLAAIGIPCGLASILFLLLTHRWLLPNRKPVIIGDDLRQYTLEMVVASDSPVAEKTIEQVGLRNLPQLYLVEIIRNKLIIPAPSPQETLKNGDRLIFVGAIDSVVDLYRFRGLEPATDQVFKLDTPPLERCLIEAVVSPACPLVGKTIREGKFRNQYNGVVLAVGRDGNRLSGKIGDIRLQVGDTLLIEANPNFVSQHRISQELYVIDGMPNTEPLRHQQAPLALVILITMVLLAALGWMSMLKAAVLAAIAMIATQCCSPNKALRNIDWSVLLVIGAALAIGKALELTGAAEAIATTFIGYAGNNPWLALAVIYGITSLLTEVITNNAAAALIFPISLAVANGLSVSYLPFVIALMIAASASFATPIGYQTNMMVYGPGGYKFTDFMRVGIPLNILFGIVTVCLTPFIFPF